MQNQNPADKLLNQIRREISSIYDKSEISLKIKITNYLQIFYKEDTKKRELLKSGKISETDYRNWRILNIITGKKWQSVLSALAKELTASDTLADDVVFQKLQQAYTEGRYYGIYEVEHQTGIATGQAKNISSNADSLPKRDNSKPDRDFNRNKRNIESKLMIMIMRFGIPVSAVTGNMQRVTSLNQLYANNNAYILVTGAENAGRIDSYQALNKLGFNLSKTWITRGDRRVRNSHGDINRNCIELGKRFRNGCRFPCDPRGELDEICNCRCKMLVTAGEFKYSQAKVNERLKKLTYKQWRENLKDV
ncbi:MAG: hypothetical protein IJ642_14045 [Oscillospiraceae bacterium]|nr:hypothetical protein [Oscillospiraceae bacterium]MBR1530401.1 hypothetical protein [Oscillospiraceae bacterium]